MFRGNIRRGKWFFYLPSLLQGSSTDLSKITPCLPQRGRKFCLERDCSCSRDNARQEREGERKEGEGKGREGERREGKKKERERKGRGQLYEESELDIEWNPGFAQFAGNFPQGWISLSKLIASIWKQSICGCSFCWVFCSSCVSEALTVAYELAGWFHPDLTEQ